MCQATDRHTEGGCEGSGGGGTSCGVLGHARLDDAAQVRRDRAGQRRDGIVDVRESRRDGRAGVERLAPGEHLVPHDTERVDVARAGRRPAEGLLGSEVVRRAEHLTGAGVPGAVDGAGDAEVGELDPALGREQDVGRLDVAVHDAGGVRGGQGQRSLSEDRAGLLRRHRAAGDELRERLSLDELHHEVGVAAVLAVVVDRRDVGMRQGCGMPCLIPEAVGERRLARGVRAHDLDGDLTAEDGVARLPDVPHPAGRDGFGQGVAVAQNHAFVGVHLSTASMTALATGPPSSPPAASLPALPPSSTTTATATFGSFAGAKEVNHACGA